MATVKLEERVSKLEAEIAGLKEELRSASNGSPWWQQIVGSFKGDRYYAEAMELGREYRESQRPRAKKKKK